jgi:hypothetical protein
VAGGSAICNVVTQTVQAYILFSRIGRQWIASIESSENMTDPIVLEYPGSTTYSVPIVLSEIFTETIGIMTVNTTVGAPALKLLGSASAITSIVFQVESASTYANLKTVSNVVYLKQQQSLVVAQGGFCYAAATLFSICGFICFFGSIQAARLTCAMSVTQVMAMSAGSNNLVQELNGFCNGARQFERPIYINVIDAEYNGNHEKHAQLTTENQIPEDPAVRLRASV